MAARDQIDGYRLFVRIEQGKVRLITRNGLDWTGKFPELARAFGQLPLDTALIDGDPFISTWTGRQFFRPAGRYRQRQD